MRQKWYCVTDLPNQAEAPASKPLGLVREDDELMLAITPRGTEIVDPHDPSKYWDYFGGTD